jgi:hypothetical protein
VNDDALIVSLGRLGNEVAIRVLAREFPGNDDYWDGNWIRTQLIVTNGGVRADFHSFMRAEEFADFAEQVASLAQSPTGTATFETMENWLRLGITRVAEGTLDVRCAVHDADRFGSYLEFAIQDLDHTSLHPLAAALKAVVEQFPVVGQP